MAELTRWATTTEVIAFLSSHGVTVSADTVRGWARRAQIESFKLPGGQLRLSGPDVEKLLPAAGGGESR